jgi:hypothetical protein
MSSLLEIVYNASTVLTALWICKRRRMSIRYGGGTWLKNCWDIMFGVQHNADIAWEAHKSRVPDRLEGTSTYFVSCTYIRVNLYWGYSIIMWQFHFGISCIVVVTCSGCLNLVCNVWVFVVCVSFGNMCTCIYCVLYCLYWVFCVVHFMYTFSYLFCLYCHRVTYQFQLVIIIIIIIIILFCSALLAGPQYGTGIIPPLWRQ